MAKKRTKTSESLTQLREEHNDTNAAVKILAASLHRLQSSLPEDTREFSIALGQLIHDIHPSWNATHIPRAQINVAADWLAGTSLVRALASFEKYTCAAVVALGIPTPKGDRTVCLCVLNARALADKLEVGSDETTDLADIVNWFAAIRNSVAHGNDSVASETQARAQHAWSRLHNYFRFRSPEKPPTFPKTTKITLPHVILATACAFRLAERLDVEASKVIGHAW